MFGAEKKVGYPPVREWLDLAPYDMNLSLVRANGGDDFYLLVTGDVRRHPEALRRLGFVPVPHGHELHANRFIKPVEAMADGTLLTYDRPSHGEFALYFPRVGLVRYDKAVHVVDLGDRPEWRFRRPRVPPVTETRPSRPRDPETVERDREAGLAALRFDPAKRPTVERRGEKDDGRRALLLESLRRIELSATLVRTALQSDLSVDASAALHVPHQLREALEALDVACRPNVLEADVAEEVEVGGPRP